MKLRSEKFDRRELPNASNLEFSLSFLVLSSRLTQPRPDRRLNAIENLMALMASRWRSWVPISPDVELTMSSATLEELTRWIEEKTPADGITRARLGVYQAATTDQSVPDGWIRLRLVE